MRNENTPEIGYEGEELSEEQKNQVLSRRLKAKHVKLSRIAERRAGLQVQKDSLEFRKRNYDLLLEGAYPDCERSVHEESDFRTFRKNKSEYWNTGNKAFENAVLFESYRREIMFLALLQCFGGIIPWAWTEGRFMFSKFPMNFLTLLYALAESILTGNLSAIGTGSLILLIFMGMVLLLNGMVIREYHRHASEQDYSSCVRIAGVTSCVTAGVFLAASATVQRLLGATTPLSFTNGSGVWYTMFCSIIMLVILSRLEKLPVPEPYQTAEYRSLSLAAIDEDEEVSEKGLFLEVTNYDPTLQLRPIRVMVNKLSDREIQVQTIVRNYYHFPVQSMKCEIHMLHPDGTHAALPVLEMEKTEDSDNMDEVMKASINGIGFHFRAYDEAKLYISSCTLSNHRKESSSGFSVNSDLTLEELIAARKPEQEHEAIRRPGIIGKYRMCSCGQLLFPEEKVCCLCHRRSQEVNAS